MDIFKKMVKYYYIVRINVLRRLFKKYKNEKPANPADKTAAILAVQKETGMDTFVETGTHKGGQIEAVKHKFNKIYSIELSENLVRFARARFANQPKITIIQGDSGKVLPEILENIKEPAVFWLDAHYSGGDTVQGDEPSPVLKEISCILNSDNRHRILIDDARNFDGVQGPVFKSIPKLVRKIDGSKTVSVKNDIISIS